MLDKPIDTAKILFIPTAAIDDIAKKMAEQCKQELLRMGIKYESIHTYDIDSSMNENEAMAFDAIYFTGGNADFLLQRIKETGFDKVIKKMVYSNKIYIGVSAGSLIATPNIGNPYDRETAGLCLINAYLSVHCPADATPRTDLPLPHIPLSDNQGFVTACSGYELIEG